MAVLLLLLLLLCVVVGACAARARRARRGGAAAAEAAAGGRGGGARVERDVLFDLGAVVRGLVHHEGGGLAVERVGRVRVQQELGQEDLEDVDPEECPPFERYTGEDTTFKQMNEAYDHWEQWVPQSPIEEMLKNAINSNEYIGA